MKVTTNSPVTVGVDYKTMMANPGLYRPIRNVPAQAQRILIFADSARLPAVFLNPDINAFEKMSPQWADKDCSYEKVSENITLEL